MGVRMLETATIPAHSPSLRWPSVRRRLSGAVVDWLDGLILPNCECAPDDTASCPITRSWWWTYGDDRGGAIRPPRPR